VGAGRGIESTDSEKTKDNYFLAQDWTARLTLNWLANFVSARTRFGTVFGPGARDERGEIGRIGSLKVRIISILASVEHFADWLSLGRPLEGRQPVRQV